MYTPLLATKLVVPPSKPGLVARPRLIEKLREALSYSLVLISAPAGFGKTTLLGEWARLGRPRVRTAWVSLDEGDNDPVRFWDYFIAALQTVQPGCGEEILPWVHASETPLAGSMLIALINDLSRVESDVAVILDDYHLIESQPIHDGIVYLIEHLPARLHLVVAARADPPLRLSRFRGKGMMLEIRADDLRFTLDEAATLLKEMKTPELPSEDVSELTERTEGWAVGLKMAALSMGEQKDISGFVAAFAGSQRYVMDYLVEEVLHRQSPSVRDFLVETSVLERFTAPLCNVLAGREDSEDVLLNLEREHLFLVPLDESRQWYRYEHLFADLLRHQCETIYGREQVTALHRQASQWYEDNDLPDDAIRHALMAKDWQRAMSLIYVHWEARRKRGEFNTLLSWSRVIPPEILRGHLHLCSHHALVLAETGRLDEAEVALSYLEPVVRDDAALEGEVALARGIVSRHRGDRRCIELFEKAYALLPPADVTMRSRAAMNIAHFQQRYNNFAEAERWATIARELGQRAGDTYCVSGAFNQMGIVAAYQGKLKRAAEMFEKANELVAQAAAGLLCMTQYSLNELEASAGSARLVIERYESTGENTDIITGYAYLARICLARGDEAGADTAMERLDGACRHPSIDAFWYAAYVAHRVRYAIRRNDVQEAAQWAEQLPDMAGMMLWDRPVVARLLLAQGKKEAAGALLLELYDSAVKLGATLMAMWIRIYQAMATDREESAIEYLAEALTMAEPEGAIRYFVDEGELIKPLLEKALARGITSGFTRKLLRIIDEEAWLKRAGTGMAARVPELGLLSERELEVLRLLADGISNQRIAEKLSVSLTTVKTHVHHIIGKLEVRDRRQAVRRARDISLL